MTAYRITGLENLERWLATDPPADDRLAVVRCIEAISADPDSVDTTPTPATLGLPLHVTTADPSERMVAFSVMRSPPYAKNLRSVRIARIR